MIKISIKYLWKIFQIFHISFPPIKIIFLNQLWSQNFSFYNDDGKLFHPLALSLPLNKLKKVPLFNISLNLMKIYSLNVGHEWTHVSHHCVSWIDSQVDYLKIIDWNLFSYVENIRDLLGFLMWDGKYWKCSCDEWKKKSSKIILMRGFQWFY